MDTTTLEQLLRQWAWDARSQDEVTLHLTNIDPNTTKADMMWWIDECGFAGTYDYFYLPRRFAHRKNAGYAFVNFTTREASQAFTMAMSEQRAQSQGACAWKVADLQGLEDNLALWARASVRRIRDSEALPYVRSLNEWGAHHPAKAVRYGCGGSPGGRSAAGSPAATPTAAAAGSPSSVTAPLPRRRFGHHGPGVPPQMGMEQHYLLAVAGSVVEGVRPAPPFDQGAALVRAATSQGWEEDSASSASTSVRRPYDQGLLSTQLSDTSRRQRCPQARDENRESWACTSVQNMHDQVASPYSSPLGEWGALHHSQAMYYSSARGDQFIPNASRVGPPGAGESSSYACQLPWRPTSNIGGASSSAASSDFPYHMSTSVGGVRPSPSCEPTHLPHLMGVTNDSLDAGKVTGSDPNLEAAVVNAGWEVLCRMRL